MIQIQKSMLSVLIASALGSPAAMAQDNGGEQIRLITSTDEGKTFLQLEEGGETLEIEAGEAAVADEDGMRKVSRLPQALDWPCAGNAAMSRMFDSYSLDDLESNDRAGEIARRYFEVPEVIAPIPNWIDGEYHAVFSIDELFQFTSPAYWYHTSPDREFLDPKRPESLQIALFVGTTQAVIDNNAVDALREVHGDDAIPVTFIFNDSNTVPVSYFGDNVSLEEIFKAFYERGIKVADVPMWWLGDYLLTPTISEFEKFFEIPPLDDIPPERQEKIRLDLTAHGFSRKPIIVSILAESGSMVVDQPQRIRVAAEMGFLRIPTTLNFVEQDAIIARCGPGTPVGFGNTSSISGGTTPDGGSTAAPGATAPPPLDAPPPPRSAEPPPPPASPS